MFSVASITFVYSAEAQQQITNAWTITPSISIQETYTDDVDLDSTFRQSDFVTHTRIGALINRQGPGLDLDINYELSHFFYPSLDDKDEFRHNLRANSQSELVDDHLYFDTVFSVGQNFVDRRATFASSVIPRSNNRNTVSLVDLSPYYINKVGDNFAILTTQYRFNYLSSDGEINVLDQPFGNFNSSSHEISSTLNSGSKFSKITWEFRNSYRALKYSNILDDNIYLSNLTVDYNHNRYITLIGSLGYTRRNDPLFASVLDNFSGIVWRVGGRLTPGPRTVLEVTYGKEFFGNTWNASGSYQITPNLTAEIQYLDRVGNSARFIFDDLQNEFTTNNINQAFLDQGNGRNKRALFIITGVRGRTAVSLEAGYEESTGLLFRGSRNVRRKNASINIRRIISNRLAVNLGANLFLENFPGLVEDDFYVGFIGGLEYALKDNIALSFEYIYSQRRQQIFNIIERDSSYVSASIGMTF